MSSVRVSLMTEPTIRNRTLVVDDDPVVRRMWHRSLELARFDVVAACDGAAGLARLREDATIGLVLLDLTMPVMDGREFLRAQQADAALAAIPTVVVSGSSPTAEEELNVVAVLRKPVPRDELLSVVASYCKPLDR
jgi:two-component system, NtrC family, response regulator